MKKRIVKLNENDIERLVKKIIVTEEGGNSDKPQATLTKHPSYSVIDSLGSDLEDLKRGFKDGIANSVSGSDGYHSDIDKFSSEFTNFIGKVEKLKQKINDYQVTDNKRHEAEKEQRMQEKKQMHNQRKNNAGRDGRNYSY